MKKSIIINTTKEVMRYAFLPNFILVPLLIFTHWLVVSLWFYYHYATHTYWQNLIILIIGGSLPVLTYNIWGIRRFIIHAYRITHENIIALWIYPYCEKIAHEIVNGTLLNNLEQLKKLTIIKCADYITEKSAGLPQILRFTIKIVVNQFIKIDQINYHIETLKNKDIEEVALTISDEISNQLITASNKLVPFQIIYLIPINVTGLVLLWFI